MNRLKRGQAGDTIIEVMLSTTFVMVALGGGYSLSAHSLGNALRASQRAQALSIAQSQIEFIKAAAAKLSAAAFATSYQTSTTYCINSTGYIIAANQSTGLCDPSVFNNVVNPSIYKIGVEYDGGSGVFDINAQWQNTSETGRVNILQLNYRLPS